MARLASGAAAELGARSSNRNLVAAFFTKVLPRIFVKVACLDRLCLRLQPIAFVVEIAQPLRKVEQFLDGLNETAQFVRPNLLRNEGLNRGPES